MTAEALTLLSHATSLPTIFTARPKARTRIRDFFSSHIRNPNTRRAYMEAVRQFSAFCAELGILDLAQVEPIHVAAFVEAQLKLQSKPTVKQRLAALRMLFDWMVFGQILPVNPAHAVRGPKHSQRRGKTPVLQVDEARTLMDGKGTVVQKDVLIPVSRQGSVEDAYWNYNLSPVYEMDGSIIAVLVTCQEVTQAVLSERFRSTHSRKHW